VEQKCIQGFGRETPREGDGLEDLGINYRILSLKYFIKKQDWLMWNGLIWLRIETGGWLS
jgi:hypothetical protein